MSLMMDEKKLLGPHQQMRTCGTLAQFGRLEEEGLEELGSTQWANRQPMRDLQDLLRVETTMLNGLESTLQRR